MDVYENAMVEARVGFANRMNKLVKAATAENLGFFLIYFSALGLSLHESMEKVTKKASKRCKKMGYAELVDVFAAQAEFETEHCQHMKKDTKDWVEWWNHKKALNLSAKDYLHHPMMPSMQNFVDLHVDVVEHQSLFAEIAMAYEMQRADAIHSFSLIKLTLFKLGLSALKPLSFIRRASKERAQTPLNQVVLSGFLKKHPEARPVMVDKANATLSVYADFLEDCFKLSNNEAMKYQLTEVVDIK